MQAIYRAGGDIHRETIASILGKRPEDITKDERKKAKAINFGFLYGMGAPKFQDYAKEKYEVDFTMAECKEIRKAFFRKYPMLIPWHERQRRIVQQLGYVRSPLGRRRRLPDVYSEEEAVRAEAMRQSINSPVQAVPPDLTMLTIYYLSKYPKFNTVTNGVWDGECYCLGQVHDALLFEIREDVVDKWCKRIKHVMENIPLYKLFGVRFSVPIEVETTIGTCWGDPNKEEWKEDA